MGKRVKKVCSIHIRMIDSRTGSLLLSSMWFCVYTVHTHYARGTYIYYTHTHEIAHQPHIGELWALFNLEKRFPTAYSTYLHACIYTVSLVVFVFGMWCVKGSPFMCRLVRTEEKATSRRHNYAGSNACMIYCICKGHRGDVEQVKKHHACRKKKKGQRVALFWQTLLE